MERRDDGSPRPATRTMSTDTINADPPSGERFKRRVRLRPALRELVGARELVRSLAERELRARYSQAVLGFAWAVLTPVVLVLVFTIFFRRVADVDTGGTPYVLYAYVGLLPWAFFSSSVSLGGQSLIQNLSLLNKVYCPREVFPLASVLVAALDMAISTIVLGVLFVITGFVPSATAVWVPVILAVQVAFTLGVVLAISSMVVYLRDLRHVLPIILQLGLFATPVAYSIEVIPPAWRRLYAFANPLAPVIDSYRRTVLLDQAPDWALLAPAAATAGLVLLGGYWLFKKLETGIADVA